MSTTIYRYGLDPTGLNPDNLVFGEVATLSTKQIRGVAPQYGAFFTESLQVYDAQTNNILTRGTDYQCVELLQDATLLYGKEICTVILILNQAVSPTVRINYQVLGGYYQNDATGIINLYETVMMDQRPIDWMNILNKPLEYNPSLHNHLLSDVYGFQAVVTALERVRNAIILTDVPAFEALSDWVVTEIQEYAIKRFKLIPSSDFLSSGSSIDVTIDATNLIGENTYYWAIDHIDTTNADFLILNAPVLIKKNTATFKVKTVFDATILTNKTFTISLRKGSPTGFMVATTDIISLGKYGANAIADLLNTCCVFKPALNINSASYFIIESNKT